MDITYFRNLAPWSFVLKTKQQPGANVSVYGDFDQASLCYNSSVSAFCEMLSQSKQEIVFVENSYSF